MAKNELMKAASNLPAIDKEAMAAALKGSAQEASTGGGDFDFLSYSGKRGVYSLGRDKVEPDPDAIYIVEPMMATEGWDCWKGGRPVDKHQWSLYERASKAVRSDDLEDHGPYNEKKGEGWQFSLGIGMVDIDTGRQIKFSTSSVSGRNEFSDFNGLIADEIMDGGDGCAVITLGSKPFGDQGNSKPVINVLGMVSRAEVEAFMASDDYTVDDLLDGKVSLDLSNEVAETEEVTEAPKKSQSKKQKQEEPAEEAAPKRRRRSAA